MSPRLDYWREDLPTPCQRASPQRAQSLNLSGGIEADFLKDWRGRTRQRETQGWSLWVREKALWLELRALSRGLAKT